MYDPLISILTPSYNQGKFIEKNIRSVLDQNCGSFEHVIVDGGSTDDTVMVLQKYPHLKWISEPDKGQADALNKAFILSKGEIIGWINSDDYYEPGVFSKLIDVFKDPSVQWVIGDLKIVDENGSGGTRFNTEPIDWLALSKDPDLVKQPSAFYRRSLLQKAGPWDAELFMVMDYDLWLRLVRISEPLLLNEVCACFLIHSEQKTGVRNINRQIAEIVKVHSKYHVPRALTRRVVLKKRFSALKQRLKTVLK